jgi:hypothetical protein
MENRQIDNILATIIGLLLWLSILVHMERGASMADLLRAAPINSGGLMHGDLRLELIRIAPHQVDKVPTYHFRLVHAETKEEFGEINLRIGFSPHNERYAGHVGYAVHLRHQRHS